MLRVCPSCGRESGNEFCPYCMVATDNAHETPAELRRREQSLYLALSVLGAAAVVFMAAAWAFVFFVLAHRID